MIDDILNQLKIMTKIIEKSESRKTQRELLKQGSTQETMKRFKKNYSEYRKVFDFLKDK
mgnify:CR=1 FL=1